MLPDRRSHHRFRLQDPQAADLLRQSLLEAARPPESELAVGSVVAEQRTGIGLAQRHGRGRDQIEDAGQVEGSADRLAGLGQRLELLDGRGQCGGLLLQLPDEAGILDRDHRLVGEDSDEIDLLVRERLDVIAGERDHADRLSVAQ